MKPTKTQLLLEEIVLEHHPIYQDAALRQAVLTNPNHYNAEHLVEETMSIIGGYQYINANGFDFSDGSDCKTATLSSHDNTATITSIAAKIGDLRVVLHNQYYDRLDYYFMSRAGWETVREWGAAHENELRARYNKDLDVIPRWDKWRVGSFKELCLMPATISPNKVIGLPRGYNQARQPTYNPQFHNLFE